jgi:O-antigen ligase
VKELILNNIRNSNRYRFYYIVFFQLMVFLYIYFDKGIINSFKSTPGYYLHNGIDLISINNTLLIIAAFLLFFVMLNSFSAKRSIAQTALHLMMLVMAFKVFKIQIGALNVNELDIALFLMMFLLLISSKNKRIPVPKDIIFFMLLFVVILLSSFPFAYDLTVFSKSIAYWVFPFFALIVFSFASKDDIVNLLSSFYLGSIFSALLALVLLLDNFVLGSFASISSTFQNSNSFGTYLVFAIFIGLMRVSTSSKMQRKYELLLLLLIFIAFIGSMSRSSYVGFMVGFVYYLHSMAKMGILSYGKKIFNLILVITFTIVFLYVLNILLVDSPLSIVIDRLIGLYQSIVNPIELADEYGSNADRLILYEAALNMWHENPIMGVGTGQYRVLVGSDVNLPDGLVGASAHSVWLQLLAENGIIGLIGLLVLIYSIIRKRHSVLGNTQYLVRTVVVSMTISFLVTGIFNHNLYIVREAIVFWAFLGIYLAISRPNFDHKEPSQ